jgi:Protein of unknown function (DUF2950)
MQQQARARLLKGSNGTLQTTEVVMITTHFLTYSRHTLWLSLLASLATATFLVATVPFAVAQETYKTPEDAAAALLAAAKSGDKQDALKVFGPDGEGIISSGDPVNDANQRNKFVEAYDAKHQIETKDDNNATLIIGEKDWPFPVPLVKKDNGWRFDTEAGLQEILFRRIGHNELDTIQSLLAYVDAQNDYAQITRASTGTAAYALRIISEPGKKDGLYWPTQPGEEPSPLGDLIAGATSQGYKVGGGRAPYHGYYYKILTRQGPAAHGGAYDYVVRGNMIGGFALVTYPAAYRNSGVMTFLVNQDGTVFEKDLGQHTDKLAKEMTSFNPDNTWKKVDVEAPAQ